MVVDCRISGCFCLVMLATLAGCATFPGEASNLPSPAPSSRDEGPTPPPTPMPSSPPSYPPNPGYGQIQSREMATQIASDGRDHEVRVLFIDEIRMRVREQRLVSLAGDKAAERAITEILDRFRPLTLSPHGVAQMHTEEELTIEQQEIQEKAQKFFPHRGSYASISLETYSAERAVALYTALDHSPYVQSVEVVGVLSH